MSLINDALKRAKQSRKEAPVIEVVTPSLRPAEPTYRPSLWPFLVIPLLVAVVLALAGIFFWKWLDQTKHQPTQIAARSSLEPNAPMTKKIAIPNPKSPIAQVTPVPLSATAVPLTSAITNLPTATDATPNTTVAAAEPPAPPPLKLQGIFYGRKNPSAVINGKIRVVGDRIGEARVVAIGPESVTVVAAGKTNELVIP